MKWIFSALPLFVALSVHAADKKLGNVIAVERTIDNVHATCVAETQKDKGFDPRGQYFGCAFDVAKNAGDSTPGTQSLLRTREENCTVDADVSNGRVVIMYNANGKKADFSAASACLDSALHGKNDSLSFTVYTLE